MGEGQLCYRKTCSTCWRIWWWWKMTPTRCHPSQPLLPTLVIHKTNRNCRFLLTKETRFPSSSYNEMILQPAPTTSHHRPSCYLMSKYGRLKLARSKSSKIQRTSSRNWSRLLQLTSGEKYVGKFMTGCNSTFPMSSKQI